jgi:hypothetical protein
MVSGVIFDDIDTLEKAFNELKAEGKVAQDAVFHRQPFSMRGYGGGRENVPFGIELPNARYDVGFRQTKEGYQPYFESGFSPPGISADHGAKTLEGQTCNVYHGPGAVGQLAQRYRLLQLERNAHRMGSTTRRMQKEDGKIALEVTHR